nr:MBL fold metallo-hydrolase [Bacillus kwashiorkori]
MRRKALRTILKKVVFIILLVFVMIVAVITIYINTHPTFGANPTKDQKELYATFDNYKDGKFVYKDSNEEENVIDKFSVYKTDIGKGNRSPSDKIPISKIDWSLINRKTDNLTWFGHSTFLLTIDEKKLLIDPMFSRFASPVSFAGPKRFSDDWLNAIKELPPIDAVLITHDHYDHLDYQSIKKLKDKVDHFFVPYGVGNHLRHWGIADDQIKELNWWDETTFGGLKFVLTPAKHFSGRGLFNRNSTLWGGWIIIGNETRLCTSGDGSYGPHFEEIGKKYGPFDLTLIEGGQYDKRWPNSHMIPEESVQAHIDLKGRQMMLVHWGAFTLARHAWTEPIERAMTEAEKKAVNLIVPQIGETIFLEESITHPISSWWQE